MQSIESLFPVLASATDDQFKYVSRRFELTSRIRHILICYDV